MIQVYSPGNTDYTKNGEMPLTPTLCDLDAELNGAWTLETNHPIDTDDRWKYIVENAVIQAPSFNGPQLFKIRKTIKQDSGIVATAEPIFMDSIGDCFIVDKRPVNKNGQEALDIILEPNSKYRGVSNITKRTTAYYILKNAMNAIGSDDDNSFLKRWGGEIIYDNFTIYINEHAGEDRGVQLLYGKNIPIDGITETVNTNDIVTRIVPKAFNGYTLPGLSPWVDSKYINSYPTVFTKVVEFPNIKLKSDINEGEDTSGITVCETIDEVYSALRAAANEEFDRGLDKPEVTIECNMVVLRNTREYKDYADLEKVMLGDTIHCFHSKLGIQTDAKVVGIKYDCINDCVKEVTIGAVKKNFLSRVASAIQASERAITPDGTVMAEQIKGFIDGMTTTLRLQKSIAEKQDVRAIYFEDTDPNSPTFGALAIGTKGWEIADERTPDGTGWVWKTAATSKGIVADTVVTGILSDKNGNNYWNLDTGEFRLRAYPTTEEVEAAINDIEIGGRNLLRGTATMIPGSGTWNTGTWRASGGTLANVDIEDTPIEGITQVLKLDTNTAARPGVAQDKYKMIDHIGSKMVYSAWFKGQAGAVVEMQAFWTNKSGEAESSAKKITLESDNWERHWYTTPAIKFNHQAISLGYIYLDSGANELLVTGMKLEWGTKPTSWTPAPEDVEKDVADLTAYITSEIENVQQQVDGKIETFYQTTDPSTGWSADEKDEHVGDIWYDNSPGVQKSYRWDGSKWVETTSTPPTAILDKIDGKAQIFISQPKPPYQKGDLWFNSATSDIMTCVTARSTGNYTASDWQKRNKYTDDSALTTFIAGDFKTLQGQVDKKAETFYQVDDPSTSWTTATQKAEHVGDLWYKTTDSTTWRYDGTKWVQQNVPDEVFDKIDGKAQIFIAQPKPPYQQGDLWFNSATSDIMTCVTSRSSGNYTASDWQKRNKYTDDSTLTAFIAGDFKTLKSQVDKKAETWYQANDPSTSWTTAALKSEHTGDLWYKTPDNTTWRYDGSKWIQQDVPAVVFDKIDGKAQIFIAQPKPPYQKGDLWFDSATSDIMTCVTDRASGNYTASDWQKRNKYTDDSVAKTALALAEKAEGALEIIVGTQTAATGAWTGKASFDKLEDGQSIIYWLPYAGSGNATLNLTLSDGTTTGAKNCYYSGATRLTTHYAAGNAIRMIYRKAANVNGTTYEGWWADANYDSNTYDRIRYNWAITAASAITAGRIIVSNSAGKYTNIGTAAFDISKPILYAGSAIAANATGSNNYICMPNINLANNKSGWTGASLGTVYLVGKLNGNMFTPDATMFTTTVPTQEDGKVYIALGQMNSTTNCYLYPEHPMYMYYEGGFKTTNQTAYEAYVAIEEMEIGGRNFVLSSATSKTSAASASNSAYAANWTVSDYAKEALNSTDVFTVSFDFSVTGNSSTTSQIYAQLSGSALSNIKKNHIDGGTSVQVKFTGDGTFHYAVSFVPTAAQVQSGATFYVRQRMQNATDGAKFTVWNVKLEKGNKPTDWTPAPEDIEKELTELNTYINSEISTVKTQIDGKIETFYQTADPSTSWTTAALKSEHTGDIWQNSNTGKSYRWSGTAWQEMTTTPPKGIIDTIDGKAQVFVNQPTPPYQKGDLWFNSTTSDILTCMTDRASGSYTASDWVKRNKYTDDTAVDNLQIGGRNYLRNSRLMETWVKGALASISVEDGFGVATLTGSTANWNARVDSVPTIPFSLIDGQSVITSFEYQSTVNIALNITYAATSTQAGGTGSPRTKYVTGWSTTLPATGGEWKKATTPSKLLNEAALVNGSGDINAFFVQFYCRTQDGVIKIRKIKTETGTRATDWTPAPEDIEDETIKIRNYISGEVNVLKSQIDKKADTWYQPTDPSTSWSATEKSDHAGDVWYRTTDNTTWRYNGTKWEQQDIPTAVFDKIDGKAQIFISQPKPPYATGDLWFNSTTSDIMTCITARASGSYTASDWQKRNKYTDDTKANTAQQTADTAVKRSTAHYATSSTAAGTVAKVAACTDFELYTGAIVEVYFTNANTATAPTLNVNNTGAKPIYAKGATLAAKSTFNWAAKSIVQFTYNGSQWVMSAIDHTDVFNKLTKDGTEQFIETIDGKIYINGEMIKARSISANLIKTGILMSDANPDNFWNMDTGEFSLSGSAIKDFNVGGRNLLLDTAAPSLTKVYAAKNRYWSDASVTAVVPTFVKVDNLPVAMDYVSNFEVVSTANSHRCLCWYSGGFAPMQNGEEYTISCFARVTSGTKMRLWFQYGMSPYRKKQIDVTNKEWQRYSWTFTYNDADTGGTGGSRIYIGCTGTYLGTLQLCGYKLERGQVATDWTPAPEDTDGEIIASETRASGLASTAQQKADKAYIRASTNYATSSTAAATVAKVATCKNDTFELYDGAMVTVFFSTANTAVNPTLNVNGTGAKKITANGNVQLVSGSPYNWTANSLVTFVYDQAKASWIMVSEDQTETFNRLTNGGATQGLYLKNGKVYLNATYIDTGVVNADLIKTGTLDANLLRLGKITSKVSGDKNFWDLDTGELSISATNLTDMDTIEVGGRNLILNTAKNWPSAYSSATLTTRARPTVAEWGAKDAFRIAGKSGTNVIFALINSGSHGIAQSPLTFIKNQDYSASIYVKNNTTTKLEVVLNGYTAQDVPANTAKKLTWSVKGNGTSNLQFNFRTSGTGIAYDMTYWHPQIEQGKVPTEWQPAPEDAETMLTDTATGGRNLLKASDVIKSNSSYPIATYYFGDEKPIPGKPYVLSWKGILGNGCTEWGIYNSGGTVRLGTIKANGEAIWYQVREDPSTKGAYQVSTLPCDPNNITSGYDPATDIWTLKIERWTERNATTVSANTYINIYPMPKETATTVTSTIEWAKLEAGEVRSSYSKAPEDIDADLTSLDNGIDGVSTGFAIKWNYSNFTTANNGEAYICAYDRKTGAMTDANGWVMWNGVKRTVPKSMINPNTICPYNRYIYVVLRLSSATATTGTLYLVWYDTTASAWKYASLPTPTTSAAWTWANATDIVLASFVEPGSEVAFVETMQYSPPLTSQQVTSGTTAYEKAASAQTSANSAQTTANDAYKRASAIYAKCTTAAGTVAKVGTITESTFTLFNGARVCVFFSNTTSVAAPTLNIGGTGAKKIFAKGATLVAASPYKWSANSLVTFVYDSSLDSGAGGWIMEVEDQTETFNRLTNGGATQGIYLQDGKVYINGEYIKANSINANTLKAGTITGFTINAGTIKGSTISSEGIEILEQWYGNISYTNSASLKDGNLEILSQGIDINTKYGGLTVGQMHVLDTGIAYRNSMLLSYDHVTLWSKTIPYYKDGTSSVTTTNLSLDNFNNEQRISITNVKYSPGMTEVNWSYDWKFIYSSGIIQYRKDEVVQSYLSPIKYENITKTYNVAGTSTNLTWYTDTDVYNKRFNAYAWVSLSSGSSNANKSATIPLPFENANTSYWIFATPGATSLLLKSPVKVNSRTATEFVMSCNLESATTSNVPVMVFVKGTKKTL